MIMANTNDKMGSRTDCKPQSPPIPHKHESPEKAGFHPRHFQERDPRFANKMLQASEIPPKVHIFRVVPVAAEAMDKDSKRTLRIQSDSTCVITS